MLQFLPENYTMIGLPSVENPFFPTFTTVISIFLVTIVMVWKIKRVQKVKDLRGAYVLITGCDSGFGRDLAVKLDRMGFRVIATCMTEEGRISLGNDCSDQLTSIYLDISKTESLNEAVNEVYDIVPAEQGLWGLVNNAGVMGPMTPGIMTRAEDIFYVTSVNTVGPFVLTQALIPLLKTAKGRVVNASSMNGRIVCSWFLPYSISKYGCEAMSDILRRELKEVSIKVSIVEPGFFNTRILGQIAQNIGAACRNAPEHTREIFNDTYIDRLVRHFEANTVLASRKLYQVTDAYIDALTTVRPKARYVVGWDALLLFLPLSFMPAAVQDFFLLNSLELLYLFREKFLIRK